MRDPTGSEDGWTETVIDESTEIYWHIGAASSLGRYEMVVSSGEHRASMEVTVVEATTPRISADLGPFALVWKERGPVTLSLAGFPPDQSVALYLFGFRFGEQWPEYGGDERIFIAELESAKLDARGEARYEMIIPADAPDGAYCIVTPSILPGIAELQSVDPCWGGGGFGILLQ